MLDIPLPIAAAIWAAGWFALGYIFGAMRWRRAAAMLLALAISSAPAFNQGDEP